MQLKVRAISAAPSPLVEDHYSVTKRVDQGRQSSPREHIEIHRSKGGSILPNPFSRFLLLQHFDSPRGVVSAQRMRICRARPDPSRVGSIRVLGAIGLFADSLYEPIACMTVVVDPMLVLQLFDLPKVRFRVRTNAFQCVK